MTAIISAWFGGYQHEPKPLPKQDGVTEAILVSDEGVSVDGWTTVVMDLGPPRMASKIVKCLPEFWTDESIVIWIDAQVEVVSPLFAKHCLAAARGRDVAVLRHPWRDSIIDEEFAGRTDGRGRFGKDRTQRQLEHYLQLGHPHDWGLYWTSILLRRMTSRICELGRMWLSEQRRWTTFDQLSFPYVCRLHAGRPQEIPYPHEHIRIRGYPPEAAAEEAEAGEQAED